jgi:hypothetical protein
MWCRFWSSEPKSSSVGAQMPVVTASPVAGRWNRAISSAKHPLVLVGQASTAVRRVEREAEEPGVPQHGAELPARLEIRRVEIRVGRGVLVEPRAQLGAELLGCDHRATSPRVSFTRLVPVR